MWTQLRIEIEVLLRGFADAVSDAALAVGRVVLMLWSVVRPAVLLALNIVAALILLFEEWGWRPLSNLLARLARYPLWAKAELFIAGLPPYGALVALGIPSAVLIPAKLAGVYLLTTGHFITAAIVIFLAKIASTALIARIFLLTKPALMQIGWFARAYEIFVPWKDALFARVRASWAWRYGRIVKWRAEQQVHRVWEDLRPRVETAWLELKPRVRRLRMHIAAVWDAVANRIAQFRDPPRPLPPPKR
jgi:hypothetical protein